jgi:iron complex outermembrane receptor protein
MLACWPMAAAQAQIAEAAPSADAVPSSQSEDDGTEIIVTARQRSESLQDVPDSVTALSGRLIEDAGIQDMSDLAHFVPSFDFRRAVRAGAAQLTVRGLTTPQGGDLPIAVIVDGVQLPGADFFNQELLDIAQIEVLRGPQGALYGQGALAGAMLITTRRPTNNLEFGGRLSYGSGDNFHGVASISGPIVDDRLFFRVVGSYRNFDGTIENVNGRGVNGIDEGYVRGELRYEDGPWRAALTANYKRGTNGAVYQDFAPIVNGVPQVDDFDGAGITSNIIGKDENESYGGALHIERDIGDGVLSSTTAYNRLTDYTTGDADWTAADRLSQDNIYNIRLFNQDLRYTSGAGHPLRYIFGAFFQTRTIDEGLDVTFLPGSGMTGFAAHTSDQQRSRSWALFGQLNYDITSKLELTGALRYDFNHREFDNNYTGNQLRQNFDHLQPKVSLAYRWSPNFMTYATFAVGFRSGGFNAASSVLAGPIIDAETSRNYEAGFKARLPNGLGSIEGSVFRIDLTNGQLYFASLNPPSQNTINVDRSRVNGAELEIQLHPAPRFNLQGTLGITDALIKDFNGTGLNDHTPFPNVPSFAARGSASYDIPLGGEYMLTPRVDVYQRGRMYFFPDRQVRSGSFTNLNLRLTLEAPRWSLAAFVANVTDERHAETTNSTGLRTGSEPRTYGVELSFNFR